MAAPADKTWSLVTNGATSESDFSKRSHPKKLSANCVSQLTIVSLDQRNYYSHERP